MNPSHPPFTFSQLTACCCLFLSTAACQPGPAPAGTPSSERDAFADYWYQGKAEVNTYRLEQSRYGSVRTGDAILVFVTEDLSRSNQVKLDHPDQFSRDKVTVLKLNHIRRFVTGIYDYSLMSSVFTPVDLSAFPHTLKTTTSVQDWCGQAFTQFNLRGSRYQVQTLSYFETVGDHSKKIPADLLEDELWTRIRIRPESIPTGTVRVIPSGFHQRLLHQAASAKTATIRTDTVGDHRQLVLTYPDQNRQLSISFASQFPHHILEWTETENGRTVSKGKLKKSMQSAYWQENSPDFENLRDTLGLE
jgi:hypothetical protein